MPQAAVGTTAPQPTKRPIAIGGWKTVILLMVANISMYSIFQGMQQILLPTQVEQIDAAGKVGDYGILASIGALSAAIANPVIGSLSDKTRSRWGKRTPWLVTSAVLAALALLLLSGMQSLFTLGAAYLVVMFVMGAFQSTVSVILPDRVYPWRMGTAASIIGMALSIGVLIGVNVAARLAHNIWAGYAVLGAFLIFTTIVFVIACPDPSRPGGPGIVAQQRAMERAKIKEAGLHTVWSNDAVGSAPSRAQPDDVGSASAVTTAWSPDDDAPGVATANASGSSADGARPPGAVSEAAVPSGYFSALRDHDFRWAFFTCMFVMLGYWLTTTYILYTLTDYIGVANIPTHNPQVANATLTTITMVAMFISTVLSGPISDRIGRRRVFVILASLGVTGSSLIPVFFPTWPAMVLYIALSGLFFGCYMAVDRAIMTLVLPSAENAARDLGLTTIATTGPQVVGPLIAAIIISSLGGYQYLYLIAAFAALLGAVCVLPIRKIR